MSDASDGEHQRGLSAAQALERIVGGVFSVGPDGTVQYVNGSILAMLGEEASAVVGRNVYELYPHARDPDFLHYLERALETGEVEEFEAFAPRVGRWLRRRLYPTTDGVTVIVDEGRPGDSEDVPDPLREALGRARAAEQRYRDLLDSMAEGWKETTPAGDILAVNEALAAMLGYDDAADLLARVGSANDLYVDPEDRVRGLRSESGGKPRMIAAQMRRRDGGTVWVRSTLTPRYGPAGDIVSFRGFVEDITEHRDAERRRREAEERIEARERTLLAEAVHDEPLQLVVAAILRLDGLQVQLPPELAEPVEHVVSLLEQTIERLRNLVVALSPPDLRDGLAASIRALAEGLFMGTATEVEVEGPVLLPLEPEIETGAFRVLREALVNVRKHARADRVLVRLTESGETVVLEVVDDGVGGARASTEPGHLGMTSMVARAESLGGSLTVDSPAGGGTRVSLVVPVGDRAS